MRAAAWLFLVSMLGACDRVPEARPAGGADSVSVQGLVCVPPSNATAKMFQGLKPFCAGCHTAGARGFFASVEVFDALVVRDPRLVTPGQPDGSELIRLLEGRGTGAFKKMPPDQVSYAQLVGMGAPAVTELRGWVQSLTAQGRDGRPDQNAPRVTRVSAQQAQRALYQQLGLSHGDFFTEAKDYGWPLAQLRSDDMYPLQPPDALPTPRNGDARDRFYGLGGGSVLQQSAPDPTTSPTFVQTLTQVSQAWCRIALAKAGNTALFPAGSGPVGTDTAVKATIARWSLHFLAEKADAARVDEIYRTVYAPIADKSDAVTGYAGLCSYFIRHPGWIFY
jgi:hypothetical protein